MTEEKVLKPKTFRIDEETADKIRKIAETIGGNQQEAFSKLIEAYEFQSSKATLVDEKMNIERFEKYINALTRMYMVSLETNQNITETVRTEFDALLKSKDITIQNLQKQLSAAKQSEEKAVKKADFLVQENTKLQALLDSKESDYTVQIANLQSMLLDKDNLNKALSNSYAEEKQKNNSFQESIESLVQENKELSGIRAELSALHTEYDQLWKSKESFKKELQNTKVSYEQTITDLKQQNSLTLKQCKQQSQFELDKTILNIERKYQEQILALKEQKQSEVEQYQHKYFALLENFQKRKATVSKDQPLDSSQ